MKDRIWKNKWNNFNSYIAFAKKKNEVETYVHLIMAKECVFLLTSRLLEVLFKLDDGRMPSNYVTYLQKY